LGPVFKADKGWHIPNIVLYLTKIVRVALGCSLSVSLSPWL